MATPTTGVGQDTRNNANYLTRSTSLPTYNNGTACGFYYHAADPPAGQYGCVFSQINTSSTRVRCHAINGFFQYYNEGGTSPGQSLAAAVGNWYFWALARDATYQTFYIVPAATAITAYSGRVSNSGGAALASMLLLQSSPGNSQGAAGYAARVRAWSSVLTIDELNAERDAAAAVKSGSLFDAGFTALDDLGGFSVVGALSEGPASGTIPMIGYYL
jgi:hypothetical protein